METTNLFLLTACFWYAFNSIIAIPNLGAALAIGAPPGWFVIGAGWGHCDNEIDGLVYPSNRVCVDTKLKEDYGLSSEESRELMAEGNSITPGQPHGQTRNGGDSVHWTNKQIICQSASYCKCSLAKDWCKQPHFPPRQRPNVSFFWTPKYSNCKSHAMKQCIKIKLKEDYRYPQSRTERIYKDTIYSPGSPLRRVSSRNRRTLAVCESAYKCECRLTRNVCYQNYWAQTDIGDIPE